MYTYVKVKRKDIDLEHGWLLKISTFKELMDYQINIDLPRNAEGMTQLLERKQKELMNRFPEHFTNHIAGVGALTAELKGYPDNLMGITDLTSKALLNRLKDINNGKIILINHNGGYFWLDNDYEVLDTIIKETPGNPEYSMKDLKLLQWRGGIHWYSKFKEIDVVDEEGNQKWNTRSEAKEAAKIFFLKHIQI